MPRIRTIKPQFWLDENLGTIPRDARLLYIGLWNLSDDTGVFQWRPMQIKAQIFPYDEDITGDDIESWMKLLVETGDIEIIEHEGKTYGQIKSFLEHQDIKNPSKWTYLTQGNDSKSLPQSYPSPTPVLPLGKKEKKKVIGKKESNKGIELPDFLDKESWQGFVEMRKKIKSPLTDRAIGLIWKKLEQMHGEGQDPNAVLDQSTERGWKGVFPVKKESQPSREKGWK